MCRLPFIQDAGSLATSTDCEQYLPGFTCLLIRPGCTISYPLSFSFRRHRHRLPLSLYQSVTVSWAGSWFLRLVLGSFFLSFLLSPQCAPWLFWIWLVDWFWLSDFDFELDIRHISMPSTLALRCAVLCCAVPCCSALLVLILILILILFLFCSCCFLDMT